MAVTERDAAVLAWLAEVKVASTAALGEAYGHFGGRALSRSRLSRRLGQLTAGGVIGSATLHRGATRKVYWPGGQRYPIARRTLMHDLTVAELSVHLLTAGGTGLLTHNKTVPAAQAGDRRSWTRDMPISSSSHLADGMLWQPHHTAVLVEVELTGKSPARLARILNSHARRIADRNDPVGHLLYLTTSKVGALVAQAWLRGGHAVDHPDRLQILHAIDDTTLGLRDHVDPIAVPHPHH